MKKMYFQAFALVLMMVFSINTRAQMTIGGDAAPRKGALLDLESTYKGGLLLPKVSITDLSKIPAGFTDSSVQSQDTNAELKGLVVYNTNTTTGEGIYVWDGEDWAKVGAGASSELSGTPGTWTTVNPSPNTGDGTSGNPFTNACPATSVQLGVQTDYSFGAVTPSNAATSFGGILTFTASGSVAVSKGGKTGTVYVTIGACGSAPAQPASVSGMSQVSKGSANLTYCAGAVSGATEYVWTVPAGWTITSATNGECITVTAPNTTGSGNISVAAKNAVGTSSVYNFPVTVVDPSTVNPAAGTYYITGTNCFDVAQTMTAACGTTGRTNAFASNRTFQYTLNHSTGASNVTFAVQGATNLIKSLTWSGDVATIVFVDDIVSKITGNATGNTVTLYALFTNNVSAQVQSSMTLTVKDCTCCPGYLQPGNNLCWYKTDMPSPGYTNWNAAMTGCQNGSYADGNAGWRLPTIDELQNIQSVHNSLASQATSATGTTNMQSNWYWSSTEYGSGDAWYWYFGNGDKYWYYKTYDSTVRCVRSNN